MVEARRSVGRSSIAGFSKSVVTRRQPSRGSARAGVSPNEQLPSLKPRFLVAFDGNGVLERLVIRAEEQGIAVLDPHGSLGTNPQQAARAAAS